MCELLEHVAVALTLLLVGCRQKAMEPVKEVLAMIDESGIGKMSYHDFYVSAVLSMTDLPFRCLSWLCEDAVL